MKAPSDTGELGVSGRREKRHPDSKVREGWMRGLDMKTKMKKCDEKVSSNYDCDYRFTLLLTTLEKNPRVVLFR